MTVGPHTISDGAQGRKISEITDGLSNTILLVEVADSGISWAEPRDLRFNQIDFSINGREGNGISSYHPGCANVVFCDGTVRILKNTINPQLVKAMAMIDEGETLPEDAFKP
jgi:prepilin-type processing-associated H-X9-DG protein